jgi:hypothetical protein
VGKEYFVTKFMAGTSDASPKMQWWLRHGSCVSLYLQRGGVRGLGGTPMHDRIKVENTKNCASWCTLVKSHDMLMTEHLGLEMALIDATLAATFNRDEILAITDFMTENVTKQAASFAAKIQDFPVNRFRDLLLQHVKLFVESVRWYATPDDRKYAACEERRLENTLSLASFSTEWL